MLREREHTELALKKKLELMKRTLYELVQNKKGNLMDPEIIKLSQDIDTIINRLQNYKKNYHMNSNTPEIIMNQKTCY